MPIGSGIASQLIYANESTYGVVPASLAASAVPLEFKSETLELKKTTVQGQGLHAGGLYDRAGRRVLTNYDVNGGISMDLQSRHLNGLLFHMLGSWGQANATLTQMGSTGVYKAIHYPGNSLGHSMCFQKGVPTVDGVTEPFTYVGCKIVDWTITVATGALAILELTIDGRNELGGAGNSDPLNGAVPALGTWVGTPGMDVFHFREAALVTGTPSTVSNVTSLTGPTTLANVRDASIKHEIMLDVARYFLGSGGFKAEQIENNFRKISGTFTAEWLSAETMYNAFAADTSLALQLTFTGPTVGTGGGNPELFQILIPNIKLDGESPKVPGPAIITQALAFTGLDDETNNQIQVTYQSLDTV
jgi:tail tube protein